MKTISIKTVTTTDGKRLYQVSLGTQSSTGKTAGEALDDLTAKMENQEINGFLFLQVNEPDQFFTAPQQEKSAELKSLWQVARDQGNTLPIEQQAKLDDLMVLEMDAVIDRSIEGNDESASTINPPQLKFFCCFLVIFNN
jgi:hypothetical protein